MKELIVALSLLALCSAANAADTPLKPEQFAYGMEIRSDGNAGIYRLNLPLAVYQQTQFKDLRDLRVFNADGEVVPYVVTRASGSVSVAENPIELPRFPVSASNDAKLGELDLQIRRANDGTVINVTTRDANPIKPKLVGYLLDASKVAPAIKALELDWDDTTDNYSGAVTVESSDDLKIWQTLVQDAPLAHMTFAGNRLEQRRVEFPATTVIYLRLSWPGTQAGESAPPPLKRITAILADRVSDTARSWTEVTGKPVAGKAGDYEFDTGGRLPIDRVRVALPQANTLALAELFARDKIDAPWRSTGALTLYRVTQNGRALNTPIVSLARDSNRYWLLRVSQAGGGLGQGAPALNFGWLPDELLFVARGRAPFQLVYGAHGVSSGDVAVTSLLGASKGNGAIESRPASFAEPIALGGTAKLMPPAEPFAWKKWLLWGVLGAGVVLLALMAQRLMGQLQKADNQDSPPSH